MFKKIDSILLLVFFSDDVMSGGFRNDTNCRIRSPFDSKNIILVFKCLSLFLISMSFSSNVKCILNSTQKRHSKSHTLCQSPFESVLQTESPNVKINFRKIFKFFSSLFSSLELKPNPKKERKMLCFWLTEALGIGFGSETSVY